MVLRLDPPSIYASPSDDAYIPVFLLKHVMVSLESTRMKLDSSSKIQGRLSISTTKSSGA
jgi:hypothetical protein